MSLPIWTRDALSPEARPYAGDAWRLVEAQHKVSTMKLTDTVGEQILLERLIEDTKPPLPLPCRHLDYLLSAPFRYRPYPHGSRFREAGMSDGVFYAAEAPETAMAEMAFYRLIFQAESPATPWPDNPAEYTAFSVRLAVDRALDLTAPPLAGDAALWTHPTDYTACQALAKEARAASIGLLRYASVRDPAHRPNIAVLTCVAFANPTPIERQTWRMRLSSSGVQALREHPVARLHFDRDAFSADPRIAGLNWSR